MGFNGAPRSAVIHPSSQIEIGPNHDEAVWPDFYLVIKTEVSTQAGNMAGCLDVIQGMRDDAASVKNDG